MDPNAFSYVAPGDESRSGLAADSLLRGDFRSAGKALTDPASLSPHERGLDGSGWRPKGDDAVSKVLRSLANPLVVVGAVLAMKYPVPLAKNLFNFSERVAGYGAKLLPGIWRAQSARSIFRGTKFLEYLDEILGDTHRFKTAVQMSMAEGAMDLEKTLGRGPNFREQIAAAAVADGLHSPHAPSWGLVRGLLKKGIEDGTVPASFAGKLDRVGMGSEAWLRANAPEPLTRSIKSAVDTAHDMLLEEFKTVDDPKQWAAIRERFEKLGLDGEREIERLQAAAMGKERVLEKGFKFRENHFPHVSAMTPAQEEEWARRMAETGADSGYQAISSEEEAFLKRTISETEGQTEARSMSAGSPGVSKRMYRRSNAMIPSLDDVREIAEGFSPETLEGLEYATRLKSQATGLPVRQYSLRSIAVMENYGHSAGKTYAWTVRGWGPLLKEQAKILADTDKQGIKHRLAVETFIPLAEGRLGQAEAMHSLAWSSMKKQAFDFFGNPNVRGILGERAATRMQDMLKTPAVQNLTWKNAGAKLAGHFYLAALGANPTSAALNLMQNMITTSGVVEGKYLLAGLQKTLQGVDKFARLAGGGEALETAFMKAFPAYAELGAPSEIEALGALRRAKAGGVGRAATVEKIKSVMMSMFTGTERFNKLWAYHAGEIKGLTEGLGAEAAKKVAKGVVEITQFPGGPLNTSVGLLNTWAPFRQFSQFPTRIAELAFSHGTALGSGAQAIAGDVPLVGGLNPGTLGRMAVSTGLLYAAGAGMGMRLPGLWEAMPAPHGEEQPFYPLPFLPPVLAIPGAVAADAFSGGGEEGDWSRTRRTLPLLVPGGVSLSRFATVASPKVAQMLGREYADYQNVQPDGSVPVFSPDGGLKGFKRPTRIIADALGWKTLTGDPEAEVTQYLVKQRDRIRDYRRAYVEAIAQNDMGEAQQVQEEYKRAYPQLGDIVIKQSDVQAVHLRHDVSRVERVLNTMPPDARAEFGQMVNVALGEGAESFMGVDPALLSGGGTVRSRDQSRSGGMGLGAQRVQQAKASEGRGVLRPDQAGPQPRASLSPFESYQSY